MVDRGTEKAKQQTRADEEKYKEADEEEGKKDDEEKNKGADDLVSSAGAW